jgi:hypothetical protein
MPVYYEYGRLTGRLHIEDASPVTVDCTANPISVAKGQAAEVTLTARNTSAKPQKVRFWPVGFVTNLGFTLDKVRGLDWQGTLTPGEEHRVAVTVTPTAQAKGSYPVGVAVIGDEGNAVGMGEVSVQA